MSLILMVIYCLTAAFFIFGLTLHDEVLQKKRQRLLSGRDQSSPDQRRTAWRRPSPGRID